MKDSSALDTDEMESLRSATEELNQSTAPLRAEFSQADEERQAADRQTDRLQTRFDLLAAPAE